MSIFPPFDIQKVFVDTWTRDAEPFFWIALTGFLVIATAGLVGNFLVLRRMSLLGDAISHSVLPGVAIAFLLAQSRDSIAMFMGAIIAGVLTTILIEMIHRKTRVKEDAAMGIVFSFLFAVGVVIIASNADHIDLDTDCVLFGEIEFVPYGDYLEIGGMELGPLASWRIAGVLFLVVSLLFIFYKELLVSSFDPGLALSLGMNVGMIHIGLMCTLSVVIVASFESVGAILVIAMLILPGATARLLSERLPLMLAISLLIAFISALGGLHLAIWLESNVASCMAIVAFALFIGAWMLGPREGLVWRYFRQRPDGAKLPDL